MSEIKPYLYTNSTAYLTQTLISVHCDFALQSALLREKRDGPRYVHAIRGARELRNANFDFASYVLAYGSSGECRTEELARGIPIDWITR